LIIVDAICVLLNKDENPRSNYLLILKFNKKDHRLQKAMVLHFLSDSREISFRLDDCPSQKDG